MTEPTDQSAERGRRDEVGGWRPLTVVWCEDDSKLAEILRRAWCLEDPDAGWRPHPDDELLFTADGDEALALAQRHHADLVISDESHSGSIGGLDLFRSLRHRPGLALCYLTGHPVSGPNGEYGAWARELGVDLLFGKPVWMADFLAELAPLVAQLRDGTWLPPTGRGIGPRIRPRDA